MSSNLFVLFIYFWFYYSKISNDDKNVISIMVVESSNFFEF